MAEQTINTVVLDPAKMPDPVLTTTLLGDVLEPVAPVITAASMQQRLAEQPGERIAAVKLRDQDYQFLEDDIVSIPGVEVVKTPTLISADRRISSPLLDSLRSAWQLERDRTAGWAVTLEDPQAGPIQVAGFQGPPPPDLVSTLDSHVQLAAKEAVVSVGTPAAIVAIQPSTGGSQTYSIIDFRAAFITDEPSTASSVKNGHTASNDNGLMIQGQDIKQLKVVFFNSKALPAEGDIPIIDYLGTGQRVIRILD